MMRRVFGVSRGLSFQTKNALLQRRDTSNSVLQGKVLPHRSNRRRTLNGRRCVRLLMWMI